jgi:altronate dehydratase
MSRVLHINPEDNVVHALSPLSPGQTVEVEDVRVIVRSEIPIGHKLAIRAIPRGEPVVKYGHVIGHALEDIQAGDYVHVHNVKDPISNWKAQYGLPEGGGKVR